MIHTDGKRTVAHYPARTVVKNRINDLGRPGGQHYNPALARKYDRKIVRTESGEALFVEPVITESGERVLALHSTIRLSA